MMKPKYDYKINAFTLVECLVVVLILMISIGGILSFRYYAVLDAQRAETQLLAARAAVVLSEAWRASKGSEDFDPQVQEFDGEFDVQPDEGYRFEGTLASDSVVLGNYQVSIEGRQFQASLMYQDDSSIPSMRTLHVVLTWQDSKQLDQKFHLSVLSQTS